MHAPYRNINNLLPLLRGRLPGQLIIQYTNRCNADCPQCGMRRSNDITRYTLGIDRARALIDDAAASGVRSLSLTGGEPLLFSDEIVDLINHASAAGIPYVRTGTNGFVFRNSESADFEKKTRRLVEKLADTSLYNFWISIDSASAEKHERIRGLEGVVRGIEKALPIFHEHDIYPAANLGINRAVGREPFFPFLDKSGPDEFFEYFKESFEQFYRFAANLGFTMANSCYPMSDEDAAGSVDQNSVYGALSNDAIVNFSAQEKALVFKALYDAIPRFRGTLRIFSPRCSLYGLMKKFQHDEQALFHCRGGTDFYFAEARNGHIHPCGYIDEPRENLPDLRKRLSSSDGCEKCEWECFRDPSDLLGPFAELFSQPIKLIRKISRDPHFFRLLREDLRYARACSYFNGRAAPMPQKIRRFSTPDHMDAASRLP